MTTVIPARTTIPTLAEITAAIEPLFPTGIPAPVLAALSTMPQPPMPHQVGHVHRTCLDNTRDSAERDAAHHVLLDMIRRCSIGRPGVNISHQYEVPGSHGVTAVDVFRDGWPVGTVTKAPGLRWSSGMRQFAHSDDAARHLCQEHPPLLLLSGKVITADGTFRCATITPERARDIAATATGFDSAVGHQSTATLLGSILGITVDVNGREAVQLPGQSAIVCKPLSRGTWWGTSAEDMIRGGYGLYLLQMTHGPDA